MGDRTVLGEMRVPGSFRDPAGYVFEHDGKLYRKVTQQGASDYEAARDAGIFGSLAAAGWLVPITEEHPGTAADGYVLGLRRLPWITYPYEWSFELLKAAALFHLDLHLELLNRNFTLSDATAYNVQFIGPKPIFIDHLSVRPYRDGEFWKGHRQFCEQFLNPLLLRAYLGRPHNGWYRGSMEGIPVADIAAILPARKKISWNVLTNIVLQNHFQSGSSGDILKVSINNKRLPKRTLIAMLSQMRKWIASLTTGDKQKTVWADYSITNTYMGHERDAKHRFVSDYIAHAKPQTIIDIGCNTGEYSERAILAGAKSVLGFDCDAQALGHAYNRAIVNKIDFLPLFLDARNPSPSQGWLEKERAGFGERMKAEGLLALAFEHHLAVAHNVPLSQVIGWLVSLAPTGVIEFIPKTDETVQKMLALRDDIFNSYDIHEFEDILKSVAQVVRSETVSQSGRKLFQYRRSS